MAKSPVAGESKTRLSPQLSPEQAAEVAAAALADTLESVAGCGADRKILALSGPPGEWIPPGFEVIAQRGPSFDRRLAAAWADAGGPGIQIGMDTPQVSSAVLDSCLEHAWGRPESAFLGPAPDGGWWAIVLKRDWDVDVFTGVPMSSANTATAQAARLADSGHTVGMLPEFRDVDLVGDALEVAALIPDSRFARVVRSYVSDSKRVPSAG